jgi:hypothetical protein
MDHASGQTVRLLESLARASDRLRSFGYRLYLENRLKSWGNNQSFSGSPFGISRDGSTTEYTRCFGLGVHVVTSERLAVIWGLDLLWDASRWTVGGDVELETESGDHVLWLHWFPYGSAETIEDCVALIERTTDEIVASGGVLSDPRIAGPRSPEEV